MADLEGYLKFWCIPVDGQHPLKNKMLCAVRDESPGELRGNEDVKDPPPQYMPIRAIDYNEKEQILYTGDEAGFLCKWDISSLLRKMSGDYNGDEKDEVEE